MAKITVVDSLMGTGKTHWTIQYFKEHQMDSNKNFLYIAPFIKEVERIIDNVGTFEQPINKGNGKMGALNDMLARQEDIAATHELFKHLDDTGIELIADGHYTLVLDEVLNVLEPLPIEKCDIQILLNSGCISLDENNYVEWHSGEYDGDTIFDELRELAENHRVICVNNCMLLWQYPPEIFQIFDEIYIMTYMFDASIMKYYFDLHNMEYEKKSIIRKEDGTSELGDYVVPDTSQFAKLIEIYEGEMNHSFYKKEAALSKSWFISDRSRNDIKKLKKNLYNYFHNIKKAKATQILWTTFKDARTKLGGKGYITSFLPCNRRSTDDFRNREVLAYCVNIFPKSTIVNYFAQNGIAIDKDKYALSEMLQWIWRSRIRNNESISIYIPSERMRCLLYDWLKVDYQPVRMMKRQPKKNKGRKGE